MIEHHQIGIVLGHARGQLVNFPAAGISSRVGFGAPGADGCSDGCTGAGHELDRLRESLIEQAIVEIDADNDCL